MSHETWLIIATIIGIALLLFLIMKIKLHAFVSLLIASLFIGVASGMSPLDIIDVIETGMGGRYDTTNCFKPILSIITNIAYDHTQFLGDSIAEIASHKAGIIKPNIPVVTGILSKQAKEVIRKEAEEKKAMEEDEEA